MQDALTDFRVFFGQGEPQVVPIPTASKLASGDESKTRSRKRRTDTALVFDAAQKVPDHVLKSIIDEWLVPCMVEEFLARVAHKARS